MFRRRYLLLSGLLLISGCLWPVREKTDRDVAQIVAHPLDLGPETIGGSARPVTPADQGAPKKDGATGKSASWVPPAMDVQTTAYLQAAPEPNPPAGTKPKFDLNIPQELPGEEAPRIELPNGKQAKTDAIHRLFPPLPPLPEEPTPLPGPGGQPYTLSDLQRLAAENSPTLRQAAADVQAAKGNLIQARAYPNPTIGFEQDPSNNGSTAGVVGAFVDQPIKTAGKLKLQAAAAEKDVENAELALKRSRSDLATQVRGAYYGLVVAQETVRVNRALAKFTDEIYRLQTEILEAGLAAPYEPAALRAQAYTARLAYKQAIATEVYAWKQLVSTIGLRQLPLTEVAGRVDRLIPAFDYDATLARVLRQHTDVLTAKNAVEKARYLLKFAQVTPIPDVDVRVAILKETALAPFDWMHTVQIGMPIPIWDQNKGNIIAAQSALERAMEEPHRVEVNLTNNFAAAYVNYQNNVSALDYYRRYILPDQVRAYRGVYERRRVDPNSAFGDLVQAQQTLAANVQTYVGLLGQLWTSVVTVADFLQTDDLFQQATPIELPALPNLSDLPPWACPHPAGQSPVSSAPCAAPAAIPATIGVTQKVPASLPPAISQAASAPAAPPQPVARPTAPGVSGVGSGEWR